MTLNEAHRTLLELLEAHDGKLTADVVEADSELSANQEVVSVAADSLALEPDIITGEPDGRGWFPYSFMLHV